MKLCHNLLKTGIPNADPPKLVANCMVLDALQQTHKAHTFVPDRQLCFFMLPEPDAHLTQECSTSGTTEGNTMSESLCTWVLPSFS